MSSTILDFQKFKLLLEEAASQPAGGKEGVIQSSIDLRFNFDSGKYKLEDIDQSKLEQLKKNIAEQALKIFSNNKLVDRKLTVKLEASTSTTPVSPALAAELGTKPGKEGNVKLCEARMNTLEQIVVSSLATGLKIDEASVRSKIAFEKINKANQGGGANPEQYQYVKVIIVQEGKPVSTIPFGCAYNQTFEGLQGTPETNYVGYGRLPEHALVTSLAQGQQFSVILDSLQIPDCVFIKYGDGPGSEFLSPFTGVKQAYGRNFVDELNKLNADQAAGLVAKINAELAAVGASGTVETLQPDFFTKDKAGNKIINVVPGRTQGGKNEHYVKRFTSNVLNADFVVRVFSPLGNTQFKIESSCK